MKARLNAHALFLALVLPITCHNASGQVADTPPERGPANEASHGNAPQNARPGLAASPPSTWKDWAAPFEDPLNAQPAAVSQPWHGDLLKPPQLPLEAVQTAAHVPQLDGAYFSCMQLDVALPALRPDAWKETVASDKLPLPMHSVTLPLEEALRLALCQNPQIRMSWATIVKTSADLGLVKSEYWPQVNASLARQRSRTTYTKQAAESVHTNAQNLSISWRVFDFGARSAKERAAQAQLRVALAGQYQALREVTGQVLDTYVHIQALSAQLKRQTTIDALGAANLASAQRRMAQGITGRGELLQAQATHTRNVLEKEKLQASLDIQYQALRYLTGVEPWREIEVTALPEELTKANDSGPGEIKVIARAELHAALEEWMQRARSANPAVIVAQAQLEAAAASVEQTKSQALPTVDLNYGQYRNGRPTQTLSSTRSNERTVGINISIPLFSGFSSTYQIRSAVAVQEHARMAHEAAWLEAEKELLGTFTQAQSSLVILHSSANLYEVSHQIVQSNLTLSSQGIIDSIATNRSLLDLQQASNDLAEAHAQWLRMKMRMWLVSG